MLKKLFFLILSIGILTSCNNHCDKEKGGDKEKCDKTKCDSTKCDKDKKECCSKDSPQYKECQEGHEKANMEEAFPTIALGTTMPLADVMMVGVNDKEVSLNKAKKENGLLVIFSCNTCPFVIKWEDRYNDLKTRCDKDKVGMIVLNPNEAKRADEDALSAMKKHATDMKYNFDYVVDAQSKLADAFGAKTTPHVFLFDKSGKLVYRGAIDDNADDKTQVKEKYLESAIGQMVKGEAITLAETKPVGCSVKRVK